jgi:pimeloyl-ACP methyl ester carboxylesterase
MPEISRPDGATIRYEVFGSGYPLLLIAPGGVSSQVEFWQRSTINPIERFAGDFQVIAMDQRHAGRSLAPMRPFSYDICNADQVAVLDALGVERAHVMGGCIGCAHVWRLISNAPNRISAAVCQDPVGLDESNSPDVFYRMFHETMRLARDEGIEAVIKAAEENPMFVVNNGAGPFAPLLKASAEARTELLEMGRERYLSLIVEFRDGIWPANRPYFTVSEERMRRCQTPMLVLPGRDAFHPTGVSRQICREAPNARCLEAECREPASLEATVEAVRDFLLEHTPIKGRAVSTA